MEGVERLCAETCSVATQTVEEWPDRRKRRKTTRISAGKEPEKTTTTIKYIYSGTFLRSRRSARKFERSSSNDAVHSGLVSVVPLPLYGPPVAGLKPFTEFPLALEPARLG